MLSVAILDLERDNTKGGCFSKALATKPFLIPLLVINTSKYLGSLSSLKTKQLLHLLQLTLNYMVKLSKTKQQGIFFQVFGGCNASSDQ